MLERLGIADKHAINVDKIVILRGDLAAIQGGQERAEVIFTAAAQGKTADLAEKLKQMPASPPRNGPGGEPGPAGAGAAPPAPDTTPDEAPRDRRPGASVQAPAPKKRNGGAARAGARAEAASPSPDAPADDLGFVERPRGNGAPPNADQPGSISREQLRALMELSASLPGEVADREIKAMGLQTVQRASFEQARALFLRLKALAEGEPLEGEFTEGQQ